MAKTKTSLAAKVKATKAKAALEVKASQTSALRKLTPLAKEINSRMDKAAVAETKASDHQLSAAICLATAKAECKVAKIVFTKWCKANITNSYETARKLAVIGEASDPAQALMDMRSSSAKRTSKSEKKRSTTGVSSHQAALPALPAGAPKSAFQMATDVAGSLDSKAALHLAENIAAGHGKRMISNHDHTELADLRKAQGSSKTVSLERVQHDFDGLLAPDKMSMAQYAAKKVGVELIAPDFDGTFDEPERPAFLDRNKPTKKKKTKARAKKAQTVARGAVA